MKTPRMHLAFLALALGILGLGILGSCASAPRHSPALPASLPVSVSLSVDTTGELVGVGHSFSSTADQILVAIPSKALRLGTVVSYIRYLDGKYVDNHSARLAQAGAYFCFRFSRESGKQFVPGSYRYKLYLDGKFIGEAEAEIHNPLTVGLLH